MTEELLHGIAQAAKELPPKVLPKLLRVACLQNGMQEAEPGSCCSYSPLRGPLPSLCRRPSSRLQVVNLDPEPLGASMKAAKALNLLPARETDNQGGPPGRQPPGMPGKRPGLLSVGTSAPLPSQCVVQSCPSLPPSSSVCSPIITFSTSFLLNV